MCMCGVKEPLSSSSGKEPNTSVTDTEDISLCEIRFGQSIVLFILMCIVVLACRNLSHRIGLSIVVAFLLGEYLFVASQGGILFSSLIILSCLPSLSLCSIDRSHAGFWMFQTQY